MRVVGLVDLDSFYSQVEVARDPERLRGQPCVVIQYNPFGDLSDLAPDADRLRPDSNGSIIAVSHEARAHGVKRNMMAQHAKALCPTLQIVQVPVAHGTADLNIYRDAGAAVLGVLAKSNAAIVCERASIDEAYLDVTIAAQQLLQQQQQGAATPTGGAAALPAVDSFDGWHVAGVEPGPDAVEQWWGRPADAWAGSDRLLAAGALVVAQARAAVAAALGFTCSAGVAHTKLLAKLGAGLNKPAQQTVVPAAAVPGLLSPLPVAKLRSLGGKFGESVMTALNVATVGELAAVPLPRLEAVVGEQDALRLSRLAQGQDGEGVKPRTLPKSLSCGKSFRGASALTSLTAVQQWLLELAQALQERIRADRAAHARLPRLLTVSIDHTNEPAVAAAAAAAASAVAVNAAASKLAARGAAAAAAAAGGADGDGGGADAAVPAAREAAACPPSSTAAAAAAAEAAAGAVRNWRAGISNVSRSCTLRHATADVVAADALALVKKWARSRTGGLRILGMQISATNFSSAPTGPSIDRFFAPAGQPVAAPAAAATAADSEQQQRQQQQDPKQQQSHQHRSPGITGEKRPATATAQPLSKQARSGDKQQGALARFLAGAQGSLAGTGAAAAEADAAVGAHGPLLPHVAPSHAAAISAAAGCCDDAVGVAAADAAVSAAAAADAAAGSQQAACVQPSHPPQPLQPLHLHDIDAEVFAALPWDLQMEVQSQLRAASRAAMAPAGRGSNGGGSSNSRGGGGGGRRGGRGKPIPIQPGRGGIAKYFKS